MSDPALYWTNNLVGTAALLGAVRHNGIARSVFSSTSAIYATRSRCRG